MQTLHSWWSIITQHTYNSAPAEQTSHWPGGGHRALLRASLWANWQHLEVFAPHTRGHTPHTDCTYTHTHTHIHTNTHTHTNKHTHTRSRMIDTTGGFLRIQDNFSVRIILIIKMIKIIKMTVLMGAWCEGKWVLACICICVFHIVMHNVNLRTAC